MQTQNLSFYHLGLAPKVLELLESMKFEEPTAVQHSAIPVALEGKDLVVVAQTGTGKTLAFCLPLIQQLSESGHQALILTPTRDLALQVFAVFKDFLNKFKLKGVTLVGGMPIGKQVRHLQQKPQVIIATPGRLFDHLERGTFHLKKIKHIVLDEADRMLDMGFAPQVTKVLKTAPKPHQTMLFSATMPKDVVTLASKYMKMPLHVEIAPPGNTSEHVTQELFIVKEANKPKLLNLLMEQYRGPVILFIRTRTKTKRIAKELGRNGVKAVEIHSDRTMGQRRQAIEKFKSGYYRVLAATDVAARGIDIKNVELVINYDLPDDIENYVHRIGRTGRAGAAGHAITFASPDQGKNVAAIEKLIKTSIPKGVHAGLDEEAFDSSGKNPDKKRTRSRRRKRETVKAHAPEKKSDKQFSKPKKSKTRSVEKKKKSHETDSAPKRPKKKKRKRNTPEAFLGIRKNPGKKPKKHKQKRNKK